MEKIEWVDLKICDWGESQIDDIEKRKLAKKEMRKFYISILVPLYESVKNDDSFSFSVPDMELTCSIFYKDIYSYHIENSGVKSEKDLLKKVQEINVLLTDEKIDHMVGIIDYKKYMGRIR